MYKTGKKLTLDCRSPRIDSRDRQTFLSPCQKYNQRSFSASSEHSMIRLPKYQSMAYPRFQLVKPTQSKLTKTLLIRPNSTAFFGGKIDDSLEMVDRQIRAEIRELNKTILILRDQNQRLKKEREEDLLLIARLSEMIKQNEEREFSQIYQYGAEFKHKSNQAYNHNHNSNHNSSHNHNHCQCFTFEQSLQESTMKSLSSKISLLQQVTHEYREELREMVTQNQRSKAQISRMAQIIETQKKRNDKLTRKILESQKEAQIVRSGPSQQLDKYFECIKNVRNREIDQIENLLKYQ